MLDLVRVKVRFGKSKVPLTMLVHDSAAMGYFHSPGLFELAQKLEQKGFSLADRNITSDSLTGIEILIGVDNFTRLIVRQRRSMGTSLFVTKGGGVIPFGPLPKWATTSSQQSTHMRCARIVCSEKPEFDVGLSELWELERVGILPDDFSPSERETISRVRSNIKKSESGYIVQLPFKDDMRPAVNYRTARGQLIHLVQRAQNDEQFGQQYDAVVNSIGISHCFKTLDYYLILMCMHLEFPNNNFLLIMFLLKYSNTNQCFFLYIQMLINVSSLFNWPMTHKDVDFTNKPISLVLGQLGV